MLIKKGISVAPGFVIGECYCLDSNEFPIQRRSIPAADVPRETARFQVAHASAVEELQGLAERLSGKIGPTVGILEAHLKLLQDQGLVRQINEEIVRNRYAAEYAVYHVCRRYRKRLTALGEGDFFAARAQDIQDIERRFLTHLTGRRRVDISKLDKPVIVVAHELTPTETAGLDREKIIGFATDGGGRTSHTAIIARSLGIPAVVGLDSITADVVGGDTLIIDGSNGMVIVQPDEETEKKYRALERNYRNLELKLSEELRDLEAETPDGCRIRLLANIDRPDDIRAALDNGADGVGLYRTEFLYVDPRDLPTERTHYEAYRRAHAEMGGREVVFRTLDLGADKFDLDGTSKEKNPFLGCRAIRHSLRNIEMFRAQLRALLRASEHGPTRIMFPMISSLQELRQAKDILEQTRQKLRAEKVPFAPDIGVGIMVEVPSAALLIDMLLDDVDFVSVGTNDLIQYTLAADRLNEKIADLYQPAHPAVLRLLQRVLEESAKREKPVSLCGEMAGEPVYTILLLGLGLREFSAAPATLPEIKQVIRKVTLKEAQEVAQKALLFRDATETLEFLRKRTKRILPDAF
ncbi:MAG: phosphoenolpyruvate--protein phosphotransferase [Planctomycetes bacterium]|nr:phosphoenolpyruvate--protein phosphotransferase [Planctomycetota bacterium]